MTEDRSSSCYRAEPSPSKGSFPVSWRDFAPTPDAGWCLYDRPGTGANTTRGSLAGASTALHTMLD